MGRLAISRRFPCDFDRANRGDHFLEADLPFQFAQPVLDQYYSFVPQLAIAIHPVHIERLTRLGIVPPLFYRERDQVGRAPVIGLGSEIGRNLADIAGTGNPDVVRAQPLGDPEPLPPGKFDQDPAFGRIGERCELPP
jgi:hypothetical protein